MRRLAVSLVVAAALAALAAPGGADAHPLGNFTVNRHAGIEVSGRDVFVRYALDLAEIPSYQFGPELRRPGFTRRLAGDLELRIDGARVPLRVLARRVTSRPGAGGLPTLRLDVVFHGAGSGAELAFRDRALPGRIGWREVTVSARDGATVVRASVPATSESRSLRSYPRDRLRSPLAVSSAVATVELGSEPGVPPRIDDAPEALAEGGDRVEGLAASDLSLGVVLVSLLVAAFWGAAHALTPGHGKAVVAAYLVGTRGTPRHAFLLGGTVTIVHTAGVFALGLVTLGLSRFLLPEQLYPWLTLASGLLVVGVGVSVLRRRLRSRKHAHHHHHQDHDHDHSSAGILGVGVAAGILPCPSALVVLLSAIALERVALGLALVLAFSLGLAATITTIGLVAVYATRAFRRLSLEGPVVRALPAVSAALILLVGLAITVRALPGLT